MRFHWTILPFRPFGTLRLFQCLFNLYFDMFRHAITRRKWSDSRARNNRDRGNQNKSVNNSCTSFSLSALSLLTQLPSSLSSFSSSFSSFSPFYSFSSIDSPLSILLNRFSSLVLELAVRPVCIEFLPHFDCWLLLRTYHTSFLRKAIFFKRLPKWSNPRWRRPPSWILVFEHWPL